MAARTTAVVSFAIFFIFGVGCSWRGAVANGGSWGGCVDNGSSCGAVSKLSNRFFGALVGARFFFGFRPRLLGIARPRFLNPGTPPSPKRLILQHFGSAAADPPSRLALVVVPRGRRRNRWIGRIDSCVSSCRWLHR